MRPLFTAIGASLLLALTWSALAQESTPARVGRSGTPGAKLADEVRIEFPRDGYTLTRAEAAKGAKLSYKIIITRDLPGIIAMGTPPSYYEPAGPSGMHPHESIVGGGQIYNPTDYGLAPPPKEIVRALKKGTFTHTFTWDGRNWRGPSDTNNPKGPPFPAGTYDVTVSLQGKVVTDRGKVPYVITGKTKLVLK